MIQLLKNIKKKSLVPVILVVFSICFYSCGKSVSGISYVTEVTGEGSQGLIIGDSVNNMPEKLIKRVRDFWGARINQEFKESYKIEAPHSRYQVPLEKYLTINKKAHDTITKVLVVNNDDKSDHLAVLWVNIFYNDEDNAGRVMKDYWVELDGKWFHVYKSMFPRIY